MRRDEHPIPSSPTPGRELTRRELLGALGAGAVAAGLPGDRREILRGTAPGRPPPARAPTGAAVTQVAPAVRPFAPGDVTLLAGPFREARERNVRYMLDLDPDRLLHNFRLNAGLEPKAPVYGGWESQEPWVDIRCHGHTLGHWLTAGALLVAATDDPRIRERTDYIVDELAACQEAAGTGLVCAFPDGGEQLENAVRGRRIVGVPWYTMHKIFAGLRDAHLYGGSERAWTVLIRLTDWAVDATAHMSPSDFETMLRVEHGGMNEVLADVHAVSGDPAHLALARSFSHRAILDPLVAGRDELDGLHANTQIPKVVGFHRLWEATGEEPYLEAARFFWTTVVENRSYVTGGHGDVEHFFPPDEFPERLGSAKTMETCCTHNMLRLTRGLFGTRPSVALGDYYERGLYNGILAAQDPDSGWNTYFQATRPGYVKLYHTPHDSFWCCTGSGLENHARYGDAIYFHDDDALWVNLFLPSEVRWRDGGLTLRQETRFPEEETVRLTVAAEAPVRAGLRIRVPGWTDGAEFAVNGAPGESPPVPGEWLTLDREWRDGDVVELRLPMRLHTEALPGEPGRVALLWGPVVLAGRLGTEGLYPGADILRNERTYGMILQTPVEVPRLAVEPERLVERVRPVPGAAEPLTFETVGIGRPEDVTLIPYYRLHHERYNLYWEVGTA